MIHFQIINSNDENIRIFSFYQKNNEIISNNTTCSLNEITELSNQLYITLSELNNNLHNRIQLFEQLKSISYKLYKKCIHPIFNNNDENLKLQFEFDIETGFIPIEFFYDGFTFLVEKHLITRKIKHNNNTKIENSINQNVSISGNFNNDLSIKKSISEELNSISSLLSKHSLNYSGPNMGPIINKSEINNLISNCNIFHYSGHFTNNENKSGWNLEKNIYTISDFQNLDKVPFFLFSNTCGVSNNLTYSKFFLKLFQLGINHILFTTGEINTEFGQKFSILFYNNLLNGNDISLSLLNARRQFIKKYGYSNPCWLQYNLIGNGDLTLKTKEVKKNIKPIINIFVLLFLITILSISFVNFKKWYKENFENKIIHIIPENVNKEFKIFDKNHFYLSSHKPLRIYNNDFFTFYADGYDSLKVKFNLINSNLRFSTNKPTQYIFNNNLYNTLVLENDSLFINLVNNGLCDININNKPQNTNIYFGFYSKKNNKRFWRKINDESSQIKLNRYFQNDLFLKIEKDKLKNYFLFNKNNKICEMKLNISSILNRNSNDWIFIGF
tara:strand:- start:5058 stop:6728 length:1671 start_codon:yes stop_codon:yes gene_type:complete